MKQRIFNLLTASILTFFVTLSLWSSVNAQTPLPPTREQIIAEIKTYAQRHATSGTSMQTQFVVDLYRDNAAGLTPQEIAQVYEEEYTLILSNQKNDPWEKLRPNVGWIVAAILLIFVAFGDAVKKKISELFNSIWDNVYKNLAGSRLLRKVAISHYKNSLFAKYQKLKVPFRPEHPLDMRDVYVPLQIAGSSDASGFDAYQAMLEHRKMMVIGAPGSGKSMLLKHIILAYAEDRLVEMSDAPIPVLLELHRFNNPDISIEQLIVAELSKNDFPKAENFASNNLKLGSFLLLFDGLDEVNSSERKRVVQTIIDFLDRFDKCRSIVTCRTVVYKGEFNDVLDKTFEIIEFNDQQIRRFLQSWEREMSLRGKSIEQLMLTLQARPRIMALARNPLMLTIITYLYTDTDFVLPQSRAEFYRKATDILLDLWHYEHNIYRASDKRQVLQHLALFNQESGKGREDRRSMDVQIVLAQVKNILPQLNLKPDVDARPLVDEIVERSGLLLSIDGGERYQFAHLTLQEYFAAAELKNNADGLFEKFSVDFDSWRETVKIWCGLDIDSSYLVQKIYEIDKVTAFECLADAQKIDQSTTGKIISDFEMQLGAEEHRDAINRAFAAVASDTRPRGAAVLKFLETMLRSDADAPRQLAAIEALSLTNLSDAANILAASYDGRPEIRKALVRMGDLAVDRLAPLANTGLVHAMEDLQAIGTPKAAKVFVPLMWGNDDKIALRAAWYLAGLLHQPNVENVLKNYDLPESYRTTGVINWVWKPFEEFQDSPVSIIAGRIAKLLSQMPRDLELKTEKDLDMRLVIPLCTIILNGDWDSSELSEKEVAELKEILKDEKWVENISRNFKSSGGSFYFLVYSLLQRERSLQEKKGELDKKEKRVITFLKSRLTPRFRSLLNGVIEKDQFNIFSIYDGFTEPTSSDWLNIFNPIKYEFESGWHFRLVWVILGLLSAGTLLLMGAEILQTPQSIIEKNISYVLWMLLVMVNWLYFWRPSIFDILFKDTYFVDHSFESNIFLGILMGPIVAPVGVIYGLGYLVYTPIARLFNKDVELNLEVVVEIIRNTLWFAMMGGLTTLVGYFITKSLLVAFTVYEVIAMWTGMFLVCIALWLRGQKLERISNNPLRGIISFTNGDRTSSSGVPPWRLFRRFSITQKK